MFTQTDTPTKTMTITFARGRLLVETPAADIYTVTSDGPVRGRDLIWVETKLDEREGRVIPANEFEAYVKGV